MAKINITPKVKMFFAFVNSAESLNTEMSRSKSCLNSEYNSEFLDAMARIAAQKDIETDSSASA